MALYRNNISYREPLYRGDKVIHESVPTAVGNLDWFVVKIYNRSGVLVHQITNQVGRGSILDLEFELLESGPGRLKMAVHQILANAFYHYKIEVYLYDTSWPWYCGFIDQLPDTGQRLGPFKYEARGYYNVFDAVVVADEDYVGYNIKTIVAALMADASSRTGFDAVYVPDKVSTSLYVVPRIKFKAVTLKKALDQLAEIARDYRVGVDEYGEFFFLPRNSGVNRYLIFVEGKDYTSQNISEEAGDIVNKIYPKIGSVQSGSNLLAPIEDAASIATYGLREAVIEIPSVFCTGADATAVMARWAQSYLEINAYPFSKGTIKNVRQRFNIPLKPDGYVRLIQTDGTTIEAAARKVSYKISNELAITITVGDDKDRLSKTLAEMYRISEFASAIIEMNAEQ